MVCGAKKLNRQLKFYYGHLTKLNTIPYFSLNLRVRNSKFPFCLETRRVCYSFIESIRVSTA